MINWFRNLVTGWRGGGTDTPYEGGRVTNLNKHWQPANYSGDSAISESWDVLIARIRDLVRNDPVMRKAVDMHTSLVIGNGLQSFSEAIEQDGSHFSEFATISDEQFNERWAIDECDVTGRGTFWDMQRLSWKETITTGFSGWLKVMVNKPGRQSPLSYQLFEFEQLDRDKDRPATRGRTKIVNGVEYDRLDRPVAAWIYDAHPYDYFDGGFTSRSTRVPADRLILNFIPDRISSHIGAAWLASLVRVRKDSDTLLANELTTRRVKALMTLFVMRDNPGGCVASKLNADAGGIDTGRSKVAMGYPAIVELERDDDIKVAESNSGGEDSAAFIDMLTDMAAMGTGLSKHRLTGKASEANMASIRAGHLDDERVIAPLQQHQAFKVVLPIRRAHNRMTAMLGGYEPILTAAEFAAGESRLQKFSCVPAGDPDFVPKDDGEAAIDRMRSGRTTPQYEIARLGFNWRKQIRDWAAWFDELEKSDLGNPDLSKGNGGFVQPFVKNEDQLSATGATGGADV